MDDAGVRQISHVGRVQEIIQDRQRLVDGHAADVELRLGRGLELADLARDDLFGRILRLIFEQIHLVGLRRHLHDPGAQLVAAVLVDGEHRCLRAELQQLHGVAHADGAGRLGPGLLLALRLQLLLRLVEAAAHPGLLFVGAGDECAVFGLLAQLLELFVDCVRRAAGVVDDELGLLASLLGGLFLLLLDLGVVFVGFFLLFLGLAAQALGFFLRLLHLLPLLVELGQDILEIHVVLADQAPRLLQDAVIEPEALGDGKRIGLAGNADEQPVGRLQRLDDVNILAVVNPTTKQILLVNTPRDYYLPLARNGELDKLTHAGLYGIDESMKVLGNLYGVQADYYVRVNFAGLVKIVDALGGVDIESDANFSCVPMETPDGNGDYTYQKYSFTKGINHVNGSQALAFARERKAFADGDNRRGQHQMTVIKAIVNKACSSAVLTKYQELLKAASDAFITNMPYADISSLVQMQLGDMADWNITTYAVSGEGSTEYCYALGDKAWVMIKDSSKVNTAKNMIQQVINGEVPTTSSSDSN